MRKRRITDEEQTILAKFVLTRDASRIVGSGSEALVSEAMRLDAMSVALEVLRRGGVTLEWSETVWKNQKPRSRMKLGTFKTNLEILTCFKSRPVLFIRAVAILKERDIVTNRSIEVPS